MITANIIVLFISSLLSPGEAGPACVGPAFLFLEHLYSINDLRLDHGR
jgi:hypothetical protein